MHVKLNGTKTLPPASSLLYCMIRFVRHKHIIRNQTPWDKGTLVRRYNLGEDDLEYPCQHFRDNFVNDITQANGRNWLPPRGCPPWDQYDDGVIPLC